MENVKIKEYNLIEAKSVADLNQKVNTYLSEGWALYKNHVIHVVDNKDYYTQVMVKVE